MSSEQSSMLEKGISDNPREDRHVEARSETSYKGQSSDVGKGMAQGSMQDNELIEVSIGVSGPNCKTLGWRTKGAVGLPVRLGLVLVKSFSLGSNSMGSGMGHKRKNQFFPKSKVKQLKPTGTYVLLDHNPQSFKLTPLETSIFPIMSSGNFVPNEKIKDRARAKGMGSIGDVPKETPIQKLEVSVLDNCEFAMAEEAGLTLPLTSKWDFFPGIVVAYGGAWQFVVSGTWYASAPCPVFFLWKQRLIR